MPTVCERTAMRLKTGIADAGCADEYTNGNNNGKWKGVILFHLQGGLLRFGELRRKMPGITQRMPTKQLRALEEDGLITRTVYPEVPPRVEYALSQTGQRLRPVIAALRAWGIEHKARLAAASAASQKPKIARKRAA